MSERRSDIRVSETVLVGIPKRSKDWRRKFLPIKIWSTSMGPRGYGIWRDWLFIFRELESNGNYFQGFGERAHFGGGDLVFNIISSLQSQEMYKM